MKNEFKGILNEWLRRNGVVGKYRNGKKIGCQGHSNKQLFCLFYFVLGEEGFFSPPISRIIFSWETKKKKTFIREKTKLLCGCRDDGIFTSVDFLAKLHSVLKFSLFAPLLIMMMMGKTTTITIATITMTTTNMTKKHLIKIISFSGQKIQ